MLIIVHVLVVMVRVVLVVVVVAVAVHSIQSIKLLGTFGSVPQYTPPCNTSTSMEQRLHPFLLVFPFPLGLFRHSISSFVAIICEIGVSVDLGESEEVYRLKVYRKYVYKGCQVSLVPKRSVLSRKVIYFFLTNRS